MQFLVNFPSSWACTGCCLPSQHMSAVDPSWTISGFCQLLTASPKHLELADLKSSLDFTRKRTLAKASVMQSIVHVQSFIQITYVNNKSRHVLYSKISYRLEIIFILIHLIRLQVEELDPTTWFWFVWLRLFPSMLASLQFVCQSQEQFQLVQVRSIFCSKYNFTHWKYLVIGTLAGWGSTGGTGGATILQKATKATITLAQCRAAIHAMGFDGNLVDDSNLCTGPLTGGVSACSGDSGRISC